MSRASAGQLAIYERGPSDAPAVVLAHGAGSSARFVDEACGPALLGAGWRLITYDLRGHGASAPARRVADHHLDVHARDLARVVAGVRGEVVAVGGISLGAHAAVRAVEWLGMPDRSAAGPGPHGSTALSRLGGVLALLPAWTGQATAGTGPHAAVAARAAELGPDGLVAGYRADLSMPRWLRETLIRDHARHDPESLVAALAALDGGEAPSREELAALPVPLGVLGWPDDPGHPEDVAIEWASLPRCARRGSLHLTDLEAGVGRLGNAVVALLTDLESVER